MDDVNFFSKAVLDLVVVEVIDFIETECLSPPGSESDQKVSAILGQALMDINKIVFGSNYNEDGQ